MKQQICCIYDSCSEAWHDPMYFQSNGQAMRSFTDACNKTDSEFNKHPGDYTLFHLGTWDPHTGKIDLNGTPQNLAIAVNLIQGEK